MNILGKIKNTRGARFEMVVFAGKLLCFLTALVVRSESDK